jgi:hypothetical protein
MKGYPGVSITRVKNYRRILGEYKGWDITYVYYKARIRVKGRSVFLGDFDTPEKAAAAYRQAKERRK